jgi:APA family basic amino acid/polyamine antiporter
MPDLRHDLGLFDLTMIAIGSTIGSGIFLTPSMIAHALPSASWILGLWVFGGFMALAGALTFAELGGMMPGAGGVYVYLTEAYGRLAGFLYGWAYFLVVTTGAIAALSLASATYLSTFLPMDAGTIPVAAIACLILVTVLNVVGVKTGSIFADLFTILKLGALVLIVAAGFGLGSGGAKEWGEFRDVHVENLGAALAVAMVGILWSYGGWQHASFAAAEARNPRRTVPRAMILGAVVVITVYVLVNVAYLLLLPVTRISTSTHIAADALEAVLGPAGGRVIAGAIFISTFGTAGIYTLTAPRIYFAMANDRLFFRTVARVHPRYRTPAVAIITQSGWAIVLILFWKTFENVISFVVFTDWIFFALTGTAVFILRLKRRDAPRPYRTFGYPVTPFIFVSVAIWFVLYSFLTNPLQALAGLLFLGCGIPVFYYWQRRRTVIPE